MHAGNRISERTPDAECRVADIGGNFGFVLVWFGLLMSSYK